MLNVTKKLFKFPWKFCLRQHSWINQWFHNKSCLLWWPVSLSIRIQTTLNHIRFVLYHNIKDDERNLCFKICWQLKTPTPTWKCTRCIMQMSYLHASAFLSKTFANSLNIQKQWQNIVWEKSNEAYPLSIRVQTTKLHFNLFLPGTNVKKNVFFFRVRVQRGIAWHIDSSSVVQTLMNNGKLW